MKNLCIALIASAGALAALFALEPAMIAGQIAAGDAKSKGGRFASQFTVYDRAGNVVRTVGEPTNETFPAAFSPDGTRAAVVTAIPDALGTDISVFDLSTGVGRRIMAGAAPTHPVWSPDGSQIAYYSYRQNSGALYRKASNGSGSEELLYRFPPSISDVHITDWSPDGRFLAFDVSAVLWVLQLAGERKAVEVMREDFQVFGARFSPDTRFLAYVSDESGQNEVYARPFDAFSVRLSPAADKLRISPHGGAGMIHWRSDGRELQYLAADGGVMAVDVTTTPALTAGSPKLLFPAPGTIALEGSPNDDRFGRISRDGQRVAFSTGIPADRKVAPIAPAIFPKPKGGAFPRQLTLYDRQGKTERVVGELGHYDKPEFSPDGTRLAAQGTPSLGTFATFVFDLAAGTATQMLSVPARILAFSPDASEIAYVSIRQGYGGVYRKSSNGTGREQLLYRFPLGVQEFYGTAWSPDERFLALDLDGVLALLPLTGERTLIELVREEFLTSAARFSPDGRFLAYSSDESGRHEIYIRAFDAASGRFSSTGARWQVSSDGGQGPLEWRSDGRELYFLAPGGEVMVVEVSATPTLRAGSSTVLFQAPKGWLPLTRSRQHPGSISRDGGRFAFLAPVPPERDVVTIAPEILSQYTGTYSFPELGGGLFPAFDVLVTLEGGQLMSQPANGGEKLPLLAESATYFYRRTSTGDTDFEFVKDDNGLVTHYMNYNGGPPVKVSRKDVRPPK